jgi:hypothetical protein
MIRKIKIFYLISIEGGKLFPLFFLKFLTALISLGMASCGQKAEPVSRTLGNDQEFESAPGADLPAIRAKIPAPLQWVDATLGEVYDDLATTWDHPTYQDEHSPHTQRLQYWADTLYDELLRTEPEHFNHANWKIPRPRIRIMEHPSRNAFISSRTVCYRSSLALAKDNGKGREGPEATLRINKKGMIGLYPAENFLCLDRTQEIIPAEWIKLYLDLNIGVQGCSYRLDQDTLVFGPECQVGGASPDRWVGRIALDLVTPWMTVTTGMLPLLEHEDELVFILSHELAHYFHAHGALVKENFSYFYQQSLDNLQRPRPKPDLELSELGNALRKLPSFRTQPIIGQRFHSEMFSYFRTALKHLIQPTCQNVESPCYEPCREILKLGENPAFQQNLLPFPQASLKGEALVQYLQYEESYGRCSESLTIGLEADPAQARVSLEAVKRIYWKAKLDPLPADYPLSHAIDDMNGQLLSEEAAQNALLQRALDKNLGYYTTEEEADMLALQWTALLGLEPAFAREFWLKFLQVAPEQDSAYNFAYDRCRNLYGQTPRWTEGGRHVVVPIGSFAESHHSKCYRIYKIDHRLDAISLRRGKDRRSEASQYGGPWETLFGQ